jgi:hypothetical protein
VSENLVDPEALKVARLLSAHQCPCRMCDAYRALLTAYDALGVAAKKAHAAERAAAYSLQNLAAQTTVKSEPRQK